MSENEPCAPTTEPSCRRSAMMDATKMVSMSSEAPDEAGYRRALEQAAPNGVGPAAAVAPS